MEPGSILPEIGGFSIAANTSREAMTVPRVPKLASTHLVRAVLDDRDG